MSLFQSIFKIEKPADSEKVRRNKLRIMLIIEIVVGLVLVFFFLISIKMIK